MNESLIGTENPDARRPGTDNPLPLALDESTLLTQMRIQECRSMLANLVRAHEKKWFGRGPDEVGVEAIGSTLILMCRSVLAKHEAALLNGPSHREERRALEDFRAACFARSKASLIRGISDVLRRPVLEVGYCLLPDLNESIYAIRVEGGAKTSTPRSLNGHADIG
jgi:uncharacterized protein YbcI